MSRTTILPHLQTTDVEASPWMVSIRNQLLTSELATGWDYQTPLHAASTIEADPFSIRQDCSLHSEDRLGIVALWHSSSTNVRERAFFTELSQAGPVKIEFEIPPGRVGGILRFSRQIVLVGTGQSQVPFAAVRPGSILWQENRHPPTGLILEGEAARFPTEVIDFSAAPVGEPEAAWWLSMTLDDLEVSPLQALRLYLNGEHPMMKRMLAGGEDEAIQMVRSALEWDVARSIVTHALENSDFVHGFGTFPSDSLGEMVEFLAYKYWPGRDAKSLRALKEGNPGRFEYQLQAGLAFMRSSP